MVRNQAFGPVLPQLAPMRLQLIRLVLFFVVLVCVWEGGLLFGRVAMPAFCNRSLL